MLAEKSKKLVIGLTGHYATGKSTVSNFFADYQYQIIEVDELGHQALIDKKEDIIKRFGKNILNENGEIHRKKLGQVVFSDHDKLKQLEQIVHPWMRNRVQEIIDSSESTKILISAAILIEMKLHTLCYNVVLITAPENKILAWGLQRDGLSKMEIKQRLKNQLTLKNRLKYADHLIENLGDLNNLYHKTQQIIQLIESNYDQEARP